MIWLVVFAFVMLMVCSVCFRIAVCNPIATVFNGIVDIYKYFRYKRWNELETGRLICYTALFGKGKTLSVVHYIVNLYLRYNNKKVWCRDRKKWVTQKVHVISNVHLNGIPYEDFVGLAQIVRVANDFRTKDYENDTLTCVLVLGDEFSVQMNSRSFKTNIDPLFLNTLLTCRHHHITLVYDAQRFNHVDALLRQVTSYCIECNKVWRFMVHEYFDAYVLENATDPTIIKPYKRTGWFIRNRDFGRYDTLACVQNLEKSVKDGDMLTEQEIIELQRNNGSDMDVVTDVRRKWRRSMKKRK